MTGAAYGRTAVAARRGGGEVAEHRPVLVVAAVRTTPRYCAATSANRALRLVGVLLDPTRLGLQPRHLGPPGGGALAGGAQVDAHRRRPPS